MVALFLNEKSEGRKYANDEKVLNPLKNNYFCFLDILLVSQKGLFTLQQEPFHTPIRLSWQSEKALLGNEENARKLQVLCFQLVKNFLKIRVFAAV